MLQVLITGYILELKKSICKSKSYNQQIMTFTPFLTPSIRFANVDSLNSARGFVRFLGKFWVGAEKSS
jgi:hypothetical protein